MAAVNIQAEPGHKKTLIVNRENRNMWDTVHTMADLAAHARTLTRPLRIATKFPRLTSDFLDRHAVTPYTLINVEGTLEVAPAIGYADLIADLVSSGQTLRDNRLRPFYLKLVLGVRVYPSNPRRTNLLQRK
jgi:ATP phosphoribosyltransferase